MHGGDYHIDGVGKPAQVSVFQCGGQVFGNGLGSGGDFVNLRLNVLHQCRERAILDLARQRLKDGDNGFGEAAKVVQQRRTDLDGKVLKCCHNQADLVVQRSGHLLKGLLCGASTFAH